MNANDTIKAYMAANIEFDRSLEILLKDLEEQGTLDDIGCEKLEYINFKNFKEGTDNTFSDIFYGVPDNLAYCISNIDNMPQMLTELTNKYCSINDCSDDWNTKTKLIIEEKQTCIDDCSQDDTYILQYKKKCYDNCPEGTVESIDNKKCLIVCPETKPFEKYEECFEDCYAVEFFNNKCIINNKNILSKEKMVENIENQIDDDSFNSLLENILNNDDNDLIIKDINELFPRKKGF